MSAFELVVVEQLGPSAETASLPEDVRLVHRISPGLGKTVALNEAISLTKGELVFFTDDDCTVAPDWLGRGVAAFERHPTAAAVFGSLVAVPHDSAIHWIPEFLPQAETVLQGRRAFMKNGGAGANLVVRRRVLDEIGPFDEVLGPGLKFRGLEEFDFFYRILRAGLQVVYDPQNPVNHHGARRIDDGSAQTLLRGYRFGEGAVLAKHLRAGDLETLRMLIRVASTEVLAVMRAMLFQGRPSGSKRLTSFLTGFVQGMRHPLDSRRRLFLPEVAIDESH